MLGLDFAKSIKFMVIFLIFSAFIFNGAYSWKSVEIIYHLQTKTALCPQDEMQTGCPLISEHISSVQGMFANVLPETRSAFLILLISLLLVFFATLRSQFRRQWRDPALSLKLLSLLRNPELPLFNHLRLAFARGILNPKAY